MKTVPTNRPDERRYMPHLDGARALAAILVLISHLAGDQVWLIPNGEWGRMGVDLFFVLSGFLISQILLRDRDASRSVSDSFASLRVFYIRRSLRIFPIYYLVIGLAVIAAYEPVTRYLLWHLGYATNVAIHLLPQARFDAVHHFWSLCIEEQFYLIWPCLMLFAPRRHLRAVMYAFVLIGIASRLAPVLIPGAGMDPLVNTRFDLFGIGALLALFWHEPQKYETEKLILMVAGVVVGLPLVALFMSGAYPPVLHPYLSVSVEVGASLFFLALIDRLAQPKPWAILAPFAWSPVRYLGKISYGLSLPSLYPVSAGLSAAAVEHRGTAAWPAPFVVVRHGVHFAGIGIVVSDRASHQQVQEPPAELPPERRAGDRRRSGLGLA